MQQLNFLDPEYLAEMERQRHLEEEEHRETNEKTKAQAERVVLIKAPIARSPFNHSHELKTLKDQVQEIESYFRNKLRLDFLEQEARDAQAAYDKAERDMFTLQKNGMKPTNGLMERVWELQDRAFDAKNKADNYKYNMGFTPALGRLDEYKARIAQIEADVLKNKTLLPHGWTTQELPLYPEARPLGDVPDGVDVYAWKQWSLKIIDCPCGGTLKPTSPNTWRCDDFTENSCSRLAFDHMNMLRIKRPFVKELEYFIPGKGLVDKKDVIPAAPITDRMWRCGCGGVLKPCTPFGNVSEGEAKWRWVCGEKQDHHWARDILYEIETNHSGGLGTLHIIEVFDDEALELPESITPESPVVQVVESCEWSGQTLLCPHCPGELAPTSPVSWVCTEDKTHKAWPHTGMMACRGLGGTRYWVPGMFHKVIPVAETPVIEELDSIQSIMEKESYWYLKESEQLNPQYLNEPVCPFCLGDLVRIAPQGWECSSNGMHSFWVHQGCGVWSEKNGESILKKEPSWAKEMVTV